MPAKATLPALRFGDLTTEDVDAFSLLGDEDRARLAAADLPLHELHDHAERLREFGTTRVDADAPAFEAHIGWRREDKAAREASDDHWRERRLTEHRARRRAEREANRWRFEDDPRAAADHDEHAAALARLNGRRRRAARLDRRARLGRVRAVVVRALTPPLRARVREHRAAPSRRATARSSRGTPSGDPDEPGPPQGGLR